MSRSTPPLRCAFLGYSWRLAQALHESPAAELVAVGLEPQRLRATEAREFCERAGLAWFDARRIRESPRMSLLLEEGLDLLVVGAFGQILPARILEAPRLGTLNLHPSLLPAYRGGWPIEWQILQGERCGGATLHWMVEAVDAGPLALRRELPIGPRDSYDDVYTRAHAAGEELLRALLLEPVDKWPRTAQPPGPAPVARRSARDGVIDWRRSTALIDRLIRAEGWRGWVRSELSAGDLVVEAAEPGPAPASSPLPGTVIEAGGNPIVASGDGALRLLRYRSPGPLAAGEKLPSSPRGET